MALDKQQVSITLASGADTKTNSIISENFKDMQNVVFSGDMTAKKMKGYDLISSLPSGEYYSSIFTKENEQWA